MAGPAARVPTSPSIALVLMTMCLLAPHLGEPPHQHIVIYAVEKLLQIHVDHPSAPFLDVPLRLAYRSVRATSRPETVAV